MVTGDDLFTTAPVTRSSAPVDVDAELEEQLRRMFADPSIPKVKRVYIQTMYDTMKAPTLEDVRWFLERMQDIRRRHEQLAAALQHAG